MNTLIRGSLVHKTLRCFAVVLLCGAVSSTARAQEYQDYEAPAARSGGDRTVGLLFGFGLFGLNATSYDSGPGADSSIFGGGTGGLGVKYLLTPDLAVRGMAIFTTASADNPANPGQGEQGIDGSQSASNFGGGVGAEYYLATGRVRPFVGATIRYVTTSTESKSTEVFDPANPDDQTTVKNDSGCEDIGGTTFCGGNEIGVAGIVGFEFFPWKKIGLAAEYQIGFGQTSRKDQVASVANTSVTEKVGSDSTFGITSLGLLTLAFYF